jgi:predicted nucleotidyltransferase
MVALVDRGQVEKIANKYAELVKKEVNASSVYLYGSYASGSYTEDSDIDIAVFSEKFSGDRIDDTLRLMRLRRKVDKRIEPHPFMKSEMNGDNPFVQEIVKTGIKIL